jgi:hypothetical protein
MDTQDRQVGEGSRGNGLGPWMRQETEIRLPRTWLLGGGIVFVLLLLIALD